MPDSQRTLATSAHAPIKDLAPNLALPWVLRLRYGIVTGEAAIILGMAYVFHVKFEVFWTLAPLFAILASNLALGRSYRGRSGYGRYQDLIGDFIAQANRFLSSGNSDQHGCIRMPSLNHYRSVWDQFKPLQFA